MYDEAVQRIECRSFSGHVYDMLDVWRKYESMDRGIGTTIPKKYLSRRTSFYEVVQQLIGSKASYVQQLAKAGSLLMYHGEQSDFLISRTLTKSTESEMITSDSESSEDEDCSITGFAQQNIFQDMVHVALRTRQDLFDTPGHSGIWKGIDLAHVEQVIPHSLYFFLRLLFASINVAHEGIEIDQTVCSIAQDIVYGVSNRRKLTPKHVGLGLVLHQATRSEALVELFHAANHTFGIDTVRRIDTTIAQNILDRFAKTGYVYIPENIVNDRMLHWSCDRCARSNYRRKEHIPLHEDDGVAERTRSTTLSRRFREKERTEAESYQTKCSTGVPKT